MDRLKREGNPPVGQLASPVPQYKDVLLDGWAELQGEGGASYVKDKDVLAKLEQARILLSGVATEAKLEEARALLESVAGKDFATQATLAQVKSELELVKAELATIKANQLSGDQKVQLSGNNALFESEVYQRYGNIGANTTEVLVDIKNRPCNLESLAVGTDYLNMGISVKPYKFDGTLGQRFGLPTKDGTNVVAVLPGALQVNWDGESDFFKNFIHDTSNQKYSFGMKRQAKFNSGVKVEITNYDSSNQRNVSVVCLVSKWGVA